MDLIKQFPDISMEVREKFRLYKKLHPRDNYYAFLIYRTDKFIVNAQSDNSRNKFIKLLIILTIAGVIGYLVIPNATLLFN